MVPKGPILYQTDAEVPQNPFRARSAPFQTNTDKISLATSMPRRDNPIRLDDTQTSCSSSERCKSLAILEPRIDTKPLQARTAVNPLGESQAHEEGFAHPFGCRK